MKVFWYHSKYEITKPLCYKKNTKYLELLNHAHFSLHKVDQHTEGKRKGFVINTQKVVWGSLARNFHFLQ